LVNAACQQWLNVYRLTEQVLRVLALERAPDGRCLTGEKMRSFLANRKGNIAVVAAVAVLPIIGAAGAAIDYSRADNVRAFMQAQSDMAALGGAQLGPTGDPKAFLEHVKFYTEQRYGIDSWVSAMSVEGKWLNDLDYRVTARGRIPVSVLGAVPGLPDDVPVSVISTARLAEPRYVYKPPTMTELDYEAGDYNRVSVYCYNEKNKTKPDKGRTQMTEISDNGGTKYKYTMPRCGADETMSYKLLNVRLVRDQPSKWDDPKQTRFEYYSDTVVKAGKDKHSTSMTKIMETVLCDNLKECKPKSQGGIIPEGKNRKPVSAKATCSPGKYMYYGWEDREPGLSGPDDDWTDIAWTDKDYDDIRIVIGCPELEKAEDRMVSLIE
jgi:hypothetical protein